MVLRGGNDMLNGHFGQSRISYRDVMQNYHQSSWFIRKSDISADISVSNAADGPSCSTVDCVQMVRDFVPLFFDW